MARPLRIEYPGAAYHVISRGNAKKPVFKDDADHENFLDALQHVNKLPKLLRADILNR